MNPPHPSSRLYYKHVAADPTKNPAEQPCAHALRVAHTQGRADALDRLGFKRASEELRLKIPTRTFHGFDAAHRLETTRGVKKATTPLDSADVLGTQLQQLEPIQGPTPTPLVDNPLDRTPAWGPPANLASGDAANRESNMGQSTFLGGI